MSSTKKVTERYKPWPFVAKFQQTMVLQMWQKKKLTCMTFPYVIPLRNKTAVPQTFLPLFVPPNGHLCQASIVEIQKFCDHYNMASHPLSIGV